MNSQRSMLLAFVALCAISTTALAKPEACTGISKKCTKDVLYDKKIGGTTYSCYDCKQALCKDGGDGALAGTQTTSVCTEKSTSFTPVYDDDAAYDATTEMAPENDPVEEDDPGSIVSPGNFRSELVIIQEEECNPGSVKLCAGSSASCDVVHDRSGKASEVCRWSSGYSAAECKKTIGIWTSASSKYAKNHPDAVKFGTAGACISEVKNIRRKLENSVLAAPSNLSVSDVTRTTLMLSWTDNSDSEYGVELYRIDPVAARREQGNGWEFIGLFEERISSRVEGTGLRSDEDYELTPGTNYCYKLRAYVGFDRRRVSDYSNSVCTKTKP